MLWLVKTARLIDRWGQSTVSTDRSMLTRLGLGLTGWIYICVCYPTAGYKITYSVATLSYNNYYANLRDYSNSLLCDLL
jgi:hypothetical protein